MTIIIIVIAILILYYFLSGSSADVTYGESLSNVSEITIDSLDFRGDCRRSENGKYSVAVGYRNTETSSDDLIIVLLKQDSVIYKKKIKELDGEFFTVSNEGVVACLQQTRKGEKIIVMAPSSEIVKRHTIQNVMEINDIRFDEKSHTLICDYLDTDDKNSTYTLEIASE